MGRRYRNFRENRNWQLPRGCTGAFGRSGYLSLHAIACLVACAPCNWASSESDGRSARRPLAYRSNYIRRQDLVIRDVFVTTGAAFAEAASVQPSVARNVKTGVGSSFWRAADSDQRPKVGVRRSPSLAPAIDKSDIAKRAPQAGALVRLEAKLLGLV